MNVLGEGAVSHTRVRVFTVADGERAGGVQGGVGGGAYMGGCGEGGGVDWGIIGIL